MLSTTKPLVCFLSWIFFYLTVEISSLTVEDQLLPDDAYHSPDGEDIKRASSFMPMRGRRDDFEEDKRASFQPMRGKKGDILLDSPYSDDKRASSFMPMRGRKAMYSDGGPMMLLQEAEELDKRGSGFMPMRGRRDDDKRASAFMPMRGRKSDVEVGGKRASSFMPMRGRKNSVSGKRVGFLPMRGKKGEEEIDDETEEDGEEVRRALEALASGGKIVAQDDKRGSNFFAMRGKREAKSHSSREATKRETMFFPSRG